MGHPIPEQEAPGLRIREVSTIECKPVGYTVPDGPERVAKAYTRFMDATAILANLAETFIDDFETFDFDDGNIVQSYKEAMEEMVAARDLRADAQEEMLRAVAGAPPQYGVCRFCYCTDTRACEGGCSWIDDSHNVCSSETCMAALEAEGKVL